MGAVSLPAKQFLEQKEGPVAEPLTHHQIAGFDPYPSDCPVSGSMKPPIASKLEVAQKSVSPYE